MNVKKEIQKIKDSLDKFEKECDKKIEKLRKECDHEFERFSGYSGTDYCCKKCELWE